MMTRLIFSDSSNNLNLARSQLEKKYKNIDELQEIVQKKKCNAPTEVDDFMLWQAIQMYDKKLESSAPGYYDSTSQLPISFKEEVINYTSDFYQVLTPRRMELLEYIQSHNPDSVKNLAAELGRDYKNIYDDLLALSKFQLIDFVREGKNKRPVSRLTAIKVLLNK